MATAVTERTKTQLFDVLLEKTRGGEIVWADVPTYTSRFQATVGPFDFTIDDVGLIKIASLDDLPPLELHIHTAERGAIVNAIRTYRRDAEDLTERAIAAVCAL